MTPRPLRTSAEFKATALTKAITWSITSLLIRGTQYQPVFGKEFNEGQNESAISLETYEPKVTDICWLDFQVENDPNVHRVEISLYGEIMPRTVQNFVELCKSQQGYGYVGSEVFRVISTFSVQMGNIGFPTESPLSQRSLYGRSSVNGGKGFEIENFRLLHDYPAAGVVSMMKDKQGKQDSRFFVTLNPSASWADNNYAAFGRISKGMEFISSLENIQVKPPSNHPIQSIKVSQSGCYDRNQ